MDRKQLVETIKARKSYLCIGLDPDLDRIPNHLKTTSDPLFEFNKAIIDATKDLCVAYKPNVAFYEVHGAKGWEALEKTLAYIGSDHLKIADAKRADIGNSSAQYAKTFFETLKADAITVSPYMGTDSVKPFLKYDNKWTIFLTLTSNTGAEDIQLKELNALLTIGSEGIQNRQRWMQLFEHVAYEVKDWASPEQGMVVVGATRGDRIEKVRNILPKHFFLVPGVGAQGGNLDDVIDHAFTDEVGVLVNSSRSILYASNGEDFASKAREKALELRVLMEKSLRDKKLI